MRLGSRRRVAASVGLVSAGGALAGLAVYLWRVGLERADMLSSVLALFAALLSMVSGAVSLPWRGRGGPTAAPRALRPVRQRTAWGALCFDDEVRLLLEATAAVAELAPYAMVGEHRTVLSSVYVRQRLELHRADDPTRERDDPQRESRSRHGTEIRPIPVSLPLERVLGEHRHLLLEGGPGQGKSTTARQLCRQLAAGWLHDGGAQSPPVAAPVLPLLVSARCLAGYRTLPWPQALARAVTEELGMRLGGAVRAELIAAPPPGVCWFVVVDGVDEVPTAERDELLAMLADRAAATSSTYRLMITSRPLSTPARASLRAGNIGHYSLVPFDRAALRSFARAWFRADSEPTGEDLASGFLAEVRAAGLDDLAAVPLLATVAVMVYARDPAHRLPRNRHDLYERYLTHLWEAGHERRQALQAQIGYRLGDLPDGRRISRVLVERLDTLLEHLAVTRLDTRDALLPAALAWLADQRWSPGRTPAAWERWIADLLCTTGVLRVWGDGVEFVHQSFAEHYAARVHSRALPARFTDGHPEWRHWIARTLDHEPVGSAVLTAWTRGHDPTALLSWLLGGAGAHQAIAVQLVSEGAGAGEATTTACLRLVEHRVWTTRTFFGQFEELFGLVRRLPAGPVVTGWLESMVERCDQHPAVLAHAARLLAERSPARKAGLVDRLRAMLHTADVHARPAVAAALVELEPSDRHEAVGALRALLGEAPSDDRIQLATALVELEPSAVGRAADALCAVLHDPGAPGYQRASAALELVEMDGDRRAEAEAVLRELVADPTGRPSDRIEMARALVAVAPETTGQVGAELSALATATAVDDRARVLAGTALAELGPRFRPEGIAALLAMLRDPTVDGYDRWHTADVLCRHDGGHVSEAIDALLAILLDPQDERYWRGNTYGTLIRLDREQRPTAADALRPLVPDRDLYPVVLRSVAAALGRLAPDSVDEVAVALGRVLDEPLGPADDACRAARDLVHLGPAFRDRTARILLAVAGDPHAAADDRATAAGLLQDLGPEYAQRAVAVLRALVDDPNAAPATVIPAADALLRCGPGHRGRGVAALLAVIDAAASDVTEREDARIYLLQELPAHRPAVAHAYRRLLADEAMGPATRVPLAKGLGVLGPEYHATAAGALHSVIEQRYATGRERLDAARALVTLGSDHRPVADRVLRAVAADPFACAADRIAAAQELLTLGLDQRAAGTAVLRAMAGDGYATPTARCAAGQELLCLGGDHRTEAVSTLRTVQADATATATDRWTSAWALARLGDGDAIGVLRQLLIEPDLPDEQRLSAARALRRWGPDLRHHTSDTLLAAMTDRRAHPGTRVAAATALLTVEPARRSEILAALWEVVDGVDTGADERHAAIRALAALGRRSDRARVLNLLQRALVRPVAAGDPPIVPRLDPVNAAELLFDLAPRHRADAAAALRALLLDADECQGRRLHAARALLGGGPADRGIVVDTLVGWLNEPGLAVADRCTLLTDLNAVNRHRAREALDGLYAAITDPTVHPSSRYQAAWTLLTIRAADDAATEALCVLVVDRTVPQDTRRAAAERLACGLPAQRVLVVDRLRGLLGTPGAGPAEAVWAAGLLGRTSAADRDEALAVLEKLAAPPHAAQIRLAAGTELIAIGGPATGIGVGALLVVAGDPLVPGHVRARAAAEVAGIPGPQRPHGRRLLLEIADNSAADLTDRVLAARRAAALPGPVPDEVLRLLSGLLDEPRIAPRLVLAAAEASARYGRNQHNTLRRLQRIAEDGTVHPYLRCQALRLLAMHHTSVRDTATAALWTQLRDPTGTPDDRRWAGESLAAVAACLGPPVRTILQDIEDDDTLEPDSRRRLRRSVRAISRGHENRPDLPHAR